MNWRATFAGGGAIELYRRKADSLGLLPRVDFAGWVDQRRAAELLAASDVLVLPSYDEGLPLVILEALTAGVPVVCSPVGAIPEVLEDGKSVVFVQLGDSQGLTDALAELGREPALRERLALEGRALYDREFSLEIFGAGRRNIPNVLLVRWAHARRDRPVSRHRWWRVVIPARRYDGPLVREVSDDRRREADRRRNLSPRRYMHRRRGRGRHHSGARIPPARSFGAGPRVGGIRERRGDAVALRGRRCRRGLAQPAPHLSPAPVRRIDDDLGRALCSARSDRLRAASLPAGERLAFRLRDLAALLRPRQ